MPKYLPPYEDLKTPTRAISLRRKQSKTKSAFAHTNVLRMEVARGLKAFLQANGRKTAKEITKAYEDINGRFRIYPAEALLSKAGYLTRMAISDETKERNFWWVETLIDILGAELEPDESGQGKLPPTAAKKEKMLVASFGGYGFGPDHYGNVSGPSCLLKFRKTDEDTPWSSYAVWDPELLPEEPSRAKTKSTSKEKPDSRKELTPTQAATSDLLNIHLDILTRKESLGGFTPRPPLLAGPSGSGKTTVVRDLASRKSLPLIHLDCGAWTAVNAREKPWTMDVLAEFVEEHEEGLIALDECDKLGRPSKGGGGDWWASVRAEIMALVECRSESWKWNEATKRKLKKKFTIVGMGTWQNLYRKKEAMGFDKPKGKETNFESLRKEEAIPEELLARFGAVVGMPPANEEDMRIGLKRIHGEAGIEIEDAEMAALARTAVESGKNARWLEDYATDLLVKKVKTGGPRKPVTRKHEQEIPEEGPAF